ncbi:MAG TPA: AI-2E family transporter [Gemmatimonadales bacterium]|nr:AI-2E family transporter [Gemmatimonadales bacterium]
MAAPPDRSAATPGATSDASPAAASPAAASPAARALPLDDREPLTPDVGPEALETPPEAPDLGKLARVLSEGSDIRTIALVGLLVLAIVYTLYFAAGLLVPIVVAIMFDFLLSPAVRWLRKFRLPDPVGGAVVVVGLLAVLVVAGWQLATPAAEWIRRGPESVAQVRHKLEALRKPVEKVTTAAAQVDSVTQVTNGAKGTPAVQIAGPSFSQQVFGGSMTFLGQLTTVVFLTYFLLAAGDLFLTKVIRMLPLFGDKRRAVEIARETEAQISVFIITSTLIGLGVGAATALAAWAVGLPSPVLWGLVAYVLNYIPYIGNLVTMVLLALAGLLTFETVGRALLVPAIFFGINVVEGNFVTPLLMSRRLQLNTVAVFVGLLFWWFVWGIAGAILAVPILAVVKIVCDRFETLAPVGEFLGE